MSILNASVFKVLAGRSQKPGAPLRHDRMKCRTRRTHEELTPEQRAELKALAELPDAAIDTSDAPELPGWSGAERGLFCRPVKQQLALRRDTDVVAWFKRNATPEEGYQTRINRALREYVGSLARRARSERA
jgi:uncharacterized protein (DUF4415 family)